MNHDKVYPTLSSEQKENIMKQAVALAKKGLGAAAPNPCVGAILTKGGEIVAQGWHKKYGYPHAEIEVIGQAKEKGLDLSQCALWVTLEPCNHYGKTPPCTQAILESGISRVFVGTKDPNPQVTGGGIEFLREKGVQVEVGIAEQTCQDLIADFVIWQSKKRPYLLLKLAITLDGKIATRSGDSGWVSGKKSREKVHQLRNRVQGVMVGGNTFFQDDPRLTCRLSSHNPERQPKAFILTSRLPSSEDAFCLLRERPQDLVFLTPQTELEESKANKLAKKGVKVWPVPGTKGKVLLGSVLERMFEEYSCYYLLVEGGGQLAWTLVEQDLVDELHIFMAPKILGDEKAQSCFSGRGQVKEMAQAYPWRIVDYNQIDEDFWLVMKSR